MHQKNRNLETWSPINKPSEEWKDIGTKFKSGWATPLLEGPRYIRKITEKLRHDSHFHKPSSGKKKSASKGRKRQ